MDHIRARPEIDKYVIGCLGFGAGGNLSLKLASTCQHIRAVFTFHADPPSYEKLNTINMVAVLHFEHSSDDQSEIKHLAEFRDQSHKAFRTRGGFKHLELDGGGVTQAARNYFIEGSPNYNNEIAKRSWAKILLFFDQQLSESRKYLAKDQVGLLFRKLSSADREHYERMIREEPVFANGVASGFSASWENQLDEDKKYFLKLAESNKDIAEGLGGPAASNFAGRSESDKKLFLEMARKNENFARAFVRFSNYAIQTEPERPILSEEDKRKMFEIVALHPEFMRDYGFGRASHFSSLDVAGKEETLAILSREATISMNDKGRREFSQGFGEGLSFYIIELGVEEKTKIRKLIDDNEAFAEGLINSFNSTYQQKLTDEQRKEFWSRWSWVPRFAKGIGVSFGMGLSKMAEETRIRFLDFTKKSPDFAWGFGLGAGMIVNRLNDRDRSLVNSFLISDVNFRSGYEEAQAF